MEGSDDDNDIFEQEGVAVKPEPTSEKKKVPEENGTTLLSRLKISVSNPEKKTKHTGLKMQETFVVYLIESTPKNANSSEEEDVTSLWRRYSEFELLRNYLVVTYPSVIVPPLPEKRANFIWTKVSAADNYDVEFLERRRAGLESFLHRIAGHSKLTKDTLVKDFICKQENWRSEVLATDYQAKQDSWLKKVNASLRVKNPDLRFDKLKSYANSLQAGTSSLLKARAKLAERIFGIYKIHGNYSRVFKEWALIEDPPLREALQKASSEIDIWANSIDILVDEEDLIAEQVKEYLYFADSLKAICKKHEAMQYDVEFCENQLMLTMAEKKRLQSGNVKSFSFSGMKARLLGADTPEQTEQKIEQLDKTIATMQDKYDAQRSSANEFLEEALVEIEAFKKRKTVDLREIFVSYAVLQMKLHKEGTALWSRFKAVFDAVLEDQKSK